MGQACRVQDTWGLTRGLQCMEVGGCRWGLPYLHPSFREVDPGCQLVADMDIWIVGEVEDLLQLTQLLCGKGGSGPPLALPLLCMEEGAAWLVRVTLVLALH